MSLVRDALAKAEREAAARAAREKGLPAALSQVPQPYRAKRRSFWPLATGLAVAALGGAIAGVVLLRSRGDSVSRPAIPASAPTSRVSAIPSPRERLPVKGKETSNSVPEASIARATPSPEAEEAISSLRTVENQATAGSGPEPTEQDGVAASTAGATPVAAAEPRLDLRATRPAAPAESTTAPSGSFVREVELAGGRGIRLGGIAWSQAAPLAYLNGRLVGVGEFVEGFRVVAIERERVVFEGPAGGFSLSLR